MPTTTEEPTGTLSGFLKWLGIVGAIGLLLFFRYYLATLADGGEVPFLKPFISEMTGAFAGGLLFFPVRWLTRRYPLNRPRRLAAYVAAMLVFSAAHTSLNWALRAMLFPLAGFGAYDYGIIPLRYAMELPGDVVVFWVMVVALYGARRLEAAREQEVRTAQLESSLARAELRSLRLQLQPHFLFNALNTISATMYDDPAAADEMLDRLSELLRASLRTAQTDEVPLRSELEVLDCYLAIMRARFGDRLRVELAVEPGVEDALVPSMILQPLVENAIRHGNVERAGSGHVTLRAARCDGGLRLVVEDDGPGSADGDDVLDKGLGLSATAERLQLLYGDAAGFEAGNVAAGGFRVTARLPFREPAS